jgi:hypothetical protein
LGISLLRKKEQRRKQGKKDKEEGKGRNQVRREKRAKEIIK